MGIEVVLDKQFIITGGTDITEEVIKQLNKK
jgi:Skp family chaperone for outer membrane proteins